MDMGILIGGYNIGESKGRVKPSDTHPNAGGSFKMSLMDMSITNQLSRLSISLNL